MKRSLIALIVMIALILVGCGQVTKNNTDDSSYTSRTIQGSMDSNFSASGFNALTSTADYIIWAQNRTTKRVYFTEVDSNGDFSLPVETSDGEGGDNFIFCLLRDNPIEFVGTIMKAPSGSATEACTGLKVGGDIIGLSVDYDASKLRGQTPTSNLPANLSYDDTMKTRLDGSGKPIGADNAGKGTGSLTGSLNENNSIDKDQDGVPDLFDAVNDGQNLDNKINTGGDHSSSAGSLLGITMFSNLKVDNVDIASADMVTNHATVCIEAIPVNASQISSILAYKVHTNYTQSRMDQCPGGFTQIDTWPTEGSLWSAGSYQLYKVLNESNDTRWTSLFRPKNNSYKPGDIIIVKVNLSSGGSEYYWLTINFKFQTIPTLTTTFASGSGSMSDPYIVSPNGGVTLGWSAPTDELGNSLTGLEYSFEFFYYDSSDQQVGTRRWTNLGTDTYTAVVSSADIGYYSATGNVDHMQIDITARYNFGDNTANKIYIKRSNW